MPLMGSLYIGTSGLQTSQNALNTTAHNLSNIDTVGYVRQQVQQSNRPYVTLAVNLSKVNNDQYGLGTIYSCAKHVRDFFLDKAYRKEAGRGMFYEVSTGVLEEAESLLGELNGEAFQASLTDLWTAVQEVAKDPGNSVSQGLLVQRSSEFIERAGAVYDGLCNYQDNLNQQIKQQIEKINKYGNQILALNDEICLIESGGVEHANDLRDVRDKLLDELAALTDITYNEEINGNVSVRVEGVDFVKGSMCYEIDMQVDENTGFVTPFWPQNAEYTILDTGKKAYDISGAEVFDVTRVISTDYNTDIGGLKAMLLARGDHRAEYVDITEGNYEDISQSIIMNLQAEFDQMIHNVSDKMNQILAKATGQQTGDLVLTDELGNEVGELKNVRYCESEPEGYMKNTDGSPIQIFTKITTPGYDKVTAKDPVSGAVKEYWVYKEEQANLPESLYTLRNLRVDPDLMQRPAKLGFMKVDGSEDLETAEAMKAAFTEEIYVLNPNVKKRTTFVDYYGDMVAQVANSGSVFRSIHTNQLDTVEATQSAREQVIGVASDEELSNMIKFQNAYNASSRYINVISEMLEHIINRLGV